MRSLSAVSTHCSQKSCFERYLPLPAKKLVDFISVPIFEDSFDTTIGLTFPVHDKDLTRSGTRLCGVVKDSNICVTAVTTLTAPKVHAHGRTSTDSIIVPEK